MVAGRPPTSFCTGPMPYDCGSTEQTPKNDGYKLPSFVNNLVSPFMSCWQPPINACGTPHRRGSRGPPPVASPQAQRKAPQPTTNIRDPHSNDVLCGRGGSSNRHIGNLNFRSVVAANKEMYVTLTKKQKMMVARKIVETIRSQDPPGRFLQKDSVTGLWFDIGLPRSLEKTSQALREKTPGSAPSKQQTLAAPVSPGGSSFTAVTVETLSDPGVETLSLTKLAKSPPQSPTPVSPMVTASSSPIPQSTKQQVGPNDIPEISIPEHLESQFRPRRRDSRPPPPHQPRYDHYPPPHHPYPYHPHAPPPYPHHHNPYPHDPHYHRPRAGHPQQHYPYPPQMPMDPRDRPYGRPPYVPSSPHHHPHSPTPHHVPSSPDRRDYHHRDPRKEHPPPRQQLLLHPQTPSPKGTPSRISSSSLQSKNAKQQQQQQQQQTHAIESTPPSVPQPSPQEPVPSIKGSGTPGRQTGEVSPGRAQAWKKRRTGLDESLTRLSLRDSTTKQELKSPSNVLQSRVRRGMEPVVRSSSSSSSSIKLARSSSESRNRGDALAGLAALSSAALLKLDEVRAVKK